MSVGIFAVKTDPETGIAVIGTIQVPGANHFTGKTNPKATKRPNEEAAPHHPPKGTAVLVTVDEGSHTISVASGDGETEVSVTLSVGDQILFCDFKPDKPVTIQGANAYTGHKSKAGSAGAVLIPVPVEDAVALDMYEWQDFS